MPGVNTPGTHVQTPDPCDLRAVSFNDADMRMIKQFKAFSVPEGGRSGSAYIQHHRYIAAVCRTSCNFHALNKIGGECADDAGRAGQIRQGGQDNPQRVVSPGAQAPTGT